MKLPFSSAFLLLALTGAAVAGEPNKAPLSRYTSLYTNSPFTSKPVSGIPERTPNPLDDYALIGVAPIENNGYRVTLADRKNPAVRTTVTSGKPNDLFKILSVTPKSGDPLATVVEMQMGDRTGTVGFDSKLLAIAPKATPPAKTAPPAKVTAGVLRPHVVPPTH